MKYRFPPRFLPNPSIKGVVAIVATSLVLVACGGSSTPSSSPDLGSAQGQTNTENPGEAESPSSPGTDETPSNPGTDETPSNPGTDETPSNPTTEPENPSTEPETPTTEPETPAPQEDETVALTGSVSTYPDSTVQSDVSTNNANLALNDQESDSTVLTREDMQPVQALVSLFLLSDVDFEESIATVKTDSTGAYTVTADDVREYLISKLLIVEGASDEEVLTSFRALGRLQVRAVIVQERDGVKKALAIQSIADPSEVNESGEPVPVAIDPIVHRVVKVIVDSIRASVASLESMGLSPIVVDQLITAVVDTVVAQIDQVLEETKDEIIEIPEGLTLDEVINNQEQELALSVNDEQLDQLAGALENTGSEPDDTQLQELQNTFASADEVVNQEDSTLESSLNSESQGLLSGFESLLSTQVNGSVEQRINQAREAGTDEALAEVFGNDTADIEQALAAVEAEKVKNLRLSLERFFLSLGLSVILEENTAGDAGIVAIQLPLPYHLSAEQLPGASGLVNRNIRLFKVGDGQLDAGSIYTDDPLAELGVPDANGIATAPFKFVPLLADVPNGVLTAAGTIATQQDVDEALARLAIGDFSAPEDFQLLDQVDVVNELRQRLQETTLVSAKVIDALLLNSDSEIPLKRIAATIAGEFEWTQEDIKLTPDGFPLYSGRSGPLAGGTNTVDSSELVRALAITLGDTPVESVRTLTERASFLAPYASRAVELALQQFAFSDQVDLTDALLEIYPADASDYRTMITGGVFGEPVPEYTRARDQLAKGLTTALPSSLYGQTLTGDSKVNIRSALFFLDYLLNGEYLIDSNKGFYREFGITRSDGVTESRFVPHYANLKRLEPIGDVSVADMMSELLNITAIDDGALFPIVLGAFSNDLDNIPVVPAYEEHNVDQFVDELGPRSEFVDLVCAVERFDGVDPDAGAENERLNLSVFGVDYLPTTGERLKGASINADITSELIEDESGLRRVYRIAGLPSAIDNNFGRDYVVRFDIEGYQNELPELHVFVDGFVPQINLCDVDAPLYIGPDQAFVHIPGLGLVSDQARFQDTFNNGVVGEDDSTTGAEQFEWVDLSNFEIPGAPLYLTEPEMEQGFGNADFRLTNSGGTYQLVGPENSEVGFARLYGNHVDGELVLSLESNNTFFPLFDLQFALGANTREVITAISNGAVSMSSTLPIAANTADNNQNQDVFNDVLLEDGFEPGALYLMRDADGQFWVLEIRYLDRFVEFDNTERAFVDLGISQINSLGTIAVPDVNYDTAKPNNIGEFDSGSIEYFSLYYGDWLVLENPSDYQGANVLPPELLTFTATEDYSQLQQAIDGIMLRFAGDHFDENIGSYEDIEAQFGSPPDFSAIPVRLDAGREGITFAKLNFDKTTSRYVLDPLPQDSARFVTQLGHNDLVAIYDSSSQSDGPIYLLRIVRDAYDFAVNGLINIEALRYDNLVFEDGVFDEREVVCFLEDRGSCPEFGQPLYSAADSVNAIGTVYDNDVDGLPALFDPNDHDPNVPGFASDSIAPGDGTGFGDSGDLSIKAVASVINGVPTTNTLMAKTHHAYPGEIENILLKSVVFGAESDEQEVVRCESGAVGDAGAAAGVNCQSSTVAGDVELELYQQSEQGISLFMNLSRQAVEELGNYVEFQYTINYRAPLNFNGDPLLCGTEVCPARPTSSGFIVVPLKTNLPLHDRVQVQVQGEDPVSWLGLQQLDVDRELRVSAAALVGAIDYELTVYCPASTTVDEVSQASIFHPEENMHFYAPAKDAAGFSIPPEFYLQIPWLADRTCRLSLTSFIESETGDLAGISLYVQDQVLFTGSSDGGSFIDNEVSLVIGESACINEDKQLTSDNCDASATLFTVDTLSSTSSGDKTVSLVMADTVIEGNSHGSTREILKSRLPANASLSFDGIATGGVPTCGEVLSETFTSSSCQPETAELQDLFSVSNDGRELFILSDEFTIEGPLNEQGNISLADSGYYSIVRADRSQDPTGATTPGTTADSASVDVLMNVMVDVFTNDLGLNEVFIRFERSSHNFISAGNDGTRQLLADVPGFARLNTTVGYDVELDMRAIVGDELKITYYVFEAQPPGGFYDLNSDGITEVEAVLDGEFWNFRFDPTVLALSEPGSSGVEDFPPQADGFRVATYPVDQGAAELLMEISGIEYLIMATFDTHKLHSFEVLGEFPVDEDTPEPLFGGQPFEDYFPVEVSAASPFSRELAEIDPTGTAVEQMRGSQIDAERIEDVLSGRLGMANFFQTNSFRKTNEDALCFGPKMFYENHPDGIDNAPSFDFNTVAEDPYPSLPSGDLGIWLEYDPVTGDACAAAQMNAQLDAARSRTFTGLITMAGMLRELTVAQQDDLLSGNEVSLVQQMNELDIPGVFFEQASIVKQAQSGLWTYQLMMFDVTAGGLFGPKTLITMNYDAGSDAERFDYSGNIEFRVEDTVQNSQCFDGSVEHVSSLTFERENAQSLKTEYRTGVFCGHNGFNGFDDNGKVDPAYSISSAEDGWESNFSIFVANLDPSNGAGSYAYSWQAGALDSHSRVLNVGLNAIEPVDGEAWYGYGQSLLQGAEFAGDINGFICNWAGPGNSHLLIEKAQRQFLQFDDVSELFVSPQGGANISYAPTNACTYDSDSGGSFLYDRDLDGELVDETAQSVDVGSGELIPFDLAPAEGTIYFGLPIEEVIKLRGYVKPLSPTTPLP